MYTINDHKIDGLCIDALNLHSRLIAIPSFSKEEQATARLLQDYLSAKNIQCNRLVNNVWAMNKHFDPLRPTLLLNSHHDTVRPNKGYTIDPFTPLSRDGKLFGLGSNDAGGCLVSLISAFLYFNERSDLKYNLVLAATAEEEISGANGIELLLPQLGEIDAAIVGEPTLMDMAVAEMGLMVIDCASTGVSGHAANDTGDNALYSAIDDIKWFRSYSFPEVSDLLGAVKMNVTIIQAGTQHNVIPGECRFTVDIRLNDKYTHNQILAIIRNHVKCEVKPRSQRLKSTRIDETHVLVQAGLKLGLKTYGSASLSDKALMPFPALKIGPGDTARSHIADEFIYLDEIKQGVKVYIKLLNSIL